ncbi:MAG: ABC transporter permease [Candidatus Njordarchaeia archaeon]
MLNLAKVFLRRKRTLLGISLGILLAFSFATTSLLSADYLGISGALRYLDQSNIDYRIDFPFSSNDQSVSSYIASILDNTSAISDYVILEEIYLNYNITFASGSIEIGPCTVAYVYNLENRSDFLVIDGNKTLSSNGFAISSGIANRLGLRVGDNLTLFYEYESFGNTTYIEFSGKVEAIYSATGMLKESLLGDVFYQIRGIGFPVYNEEPDTILVSKEKMSQILDRIPSSELYYGSLLYYRIYIKTDRAALINPWDLQRSTKNVETHFSKLHSDLFNKLSEKYHVMALSSSDYLSGKISMIYFNIMVMRFLMMFFIMPVLILGFLLTIMANWLTLTTRIKDIALLKVRGATNNSIISAVSLEGLIAGAFGGFIGAVAGAIIFPNFIKFYFPDLIKIYDPNILLQYEYHFYIIGGTVIGAVISLLFTLYVMRKGLKFKEIDALMEHLETLEEKIQITRNDYILLAVGLYGIFEMLTGQIVMRTLLAIAMNMIILFIFFVAFAFIELIAVYIGPIFFMYETSKIVASRIDKLQGLFGGIVSPFLKDLKTIAVKNFGRKPARTARLLLILALTITFSVLFPIISETSKNRQIIEASISIGGDMKITLTSLNYTDLNNVTSQMDQIEEINNYAFVSHREYLMGNPLTDYVYMVTPNYFKLKWLKNSYLVGLTKDEAYNKIQEKGNVILSINVKQVLDVKIGDNVSIIIQDYEMRVVHVKIVGFMKFIPGLTYSIIDAQSRYSGIRMLVGYKTYKMIYGVNPKFGSVIIDLKPGANATEVENKLDNIFKKLKVDAYATSFDEYLKEYSIFSLGWVLSAMSQLEIYLTSIISIAAVSLALSVALYERKKEIGIMYARGFSKRQIALIILGESFLISIISLLIGLTSAIAYSVGTMMSTQLMAFTTQHFEYPEGYLLAIPPYLLPFVVTILFIFTFSALLPLYSLFKREALIEELRVRH